MGLKNNFCNFDFLFKNFFIHMKELVELVTEIGVRGLKTQPSILKILEGPKLSSRGQNVEK